MSAQRTQGGRTGHILRRLVHVSIILVPLVYYHFIFPFFSPQVCDRLLLGFIFLILLFEFFRVKYRIVLFAQRHHEATQLSAFGWTMISLAVILMVSPSMGFSMAIVISCALADPLMGEMRLRKIKAEWVVLSGGVLVAFVWMISAYYFGFDYWLALLISVVTVAVEWPTIKWVDDNALMMLVPLVLVLIFQHLHISLY